MYSKGKLHVEGPAIVDNTHIRETDTFYGKSRACVNSAVFPPPGPIKV